jgi:proline iminopeptidase
MVELYPQVEPYAHGMLDVGDGNAGYWECCGVPGVLSHGRPGMSCPLDRFAGATAERAG